LTGGLDLAALDTGFGQRSGRVVSFAPKARRFGAVLPANSPGVHALWIPALALKIPVALKPGQREPWTPLRILEAFRRAGYPPAALGFYPCGHDGAGIILRRCGASMIFGAGPTVKPWLHDPRVEIHGPGDSKVLLGPDKSENWQQYLELIVASVAANGGRSCVNASGVRVHSQARPLAEALAEEMAEITPRSRRDPAATLAAFADPGIAHAINAAIERDLEKGGAEDVSAKYRGGPRLVEFEGGTYLLPTVIYCDDVEHPLANREYLFPFVGVAETPGEQLLGRLEASLVVTALTEEPALRQELMARSDIGRLNLGPIPTTVIEWDQPHEGNLFEHLYQQRAFQEQPFAAAMA
jgi:acyl-CoA reductase-like NAD-dependent aldehyde dehydrogenase